MRAVSFGGKSVLKNCFNKRAEMFYRLREYLRNGGTLPDDPLLRQELNSIEIDVRQSDGGIIKLISKDIIRKKIGRSPGRADALALTFAMPVKKKDVEDYFAARARENRMGRFKNYDFLKLGR